jgi:preprotein translocase subunit SecA
MGMSEDVPIESRMVTRAIERAQKKVEDYNFEIRKSLLEYDEVMDSQRTEIYTVRQEVLESVGLRERCEDMISAAIDRASETHVDDAEGFAGWCQRTFGAECPDEVARAATVKDAVSTESALKQAAVLYDEREGKVGDGLMRRIEQYLLLNAIDSKWKDHLHAIDSLKTGIGLRGYGQQDPKTEYKREGFGLFQNLRAAVEEEVASLILRIRVSGADDGEAGGDVALARRSSTPMTYHSAQTARAAPRRQAARPVAASSAFDLKRRNEMLRQAQEASRAPEAAKGDERPQPPTPATTVKEVGRNDPCPCGSGKKYKKCHGR